VQLRRELLGANLLLRGLAKGRRLHLLDDSLVGRRRLDGELLRQQVVAPVAVSDLDDVAAVSELESAPSALRLELGGVGQQSDGAGLLDRLGQLALEGSRGAGEAARNDLAA